MFFQRLVTDPDIGFNYDYMGSAEFENGATTAGRSGIALAYINKDISVKRMPMYEQWGVNHRGPVEVYVFSTKEYIRSLGPELHIHPTKESMRINDERYVGWMHVNPNWRHGGTFTPIFIVRVKQKLEDVDKFFDPAIKFHERGEV